MAAVFSLASGDENAGQISIKSIVKQLLQGSVKCSVQQPCVILCKPIAAKVLAEQALNPIKEQSMQPIKTLKETLKARGVDVNEVESIANGVTVLMCCCYLGREDAVKLLVKKGADLSLADVNGWNSLHYAVWGQNVNCIKQLVTRRDGAVLVNKGDNRGITPLMLSANRCELGVVQWLIKKGGDHLLTDAYQRTLLHWAVTTPTQFDTVRYLLGKAFNNKREGERFRVAVDTDGASPLHYASVMSSNEVVTLLITEGFDPLLQTGPAHDSSPYPLPSDEGLTPVHWACAVSRGDVLIGLLEHGKGMVNALSRQHLSPLHVLVCVDSVELSEKLISNGAMVDTMDSRGLTPLHFSCHYGHINCSRLLLDKGAAIDTLSTSRGMSSLHLASQGGHHELVGVLVDRGADRDLTTPLDGNSPVHLGAAHGKETVIETLIKRGCSVDLLRTQDGWSSLHVAASNGHIDCCRVLISNGANVNCRDHTRERCGPLDLALINNHRKCVDYLLSCNAITQGGIPHGAVCTIQLWWRYQIHKRRKRITIKWAVLVLQHSLRAWLRRCWARRVRGVREKRREVSAILIQRRWREYRTRKRELEESYRVLRAKLAKEHMTTHFLLSELRLQEATISLPPREPRTRSNPRSHTTTSLLRTVIQPAPLGTNESLLSRRKPSVARARVRINTVPHIEMRTSRHTLTAPMATQDHTHKFQPSMEAQDHTRQQHISMAIKNHTHQPHVLNNNDDKSSRVDSSHQYSLTGPDCVGGSSLPVIKRKSDSTVLTDNTTRPNPGRDQQTDICPSLPPIARPHPSLAVNKKDTDWTRMGERGKERERGVARGGRRRRTDQDKEIPVVSKVSSKDGSSDLINNAQRYHKLQQVAMLLEQAKDVHCKSDSNYEELKYQIQAALEEAIRLRVDVETLK